MDEQLRAIADPTRRAILKQAWDRELPAGRIAATFPLTRPAVSQHLKKLVDAGLLRMRRQGTSRLYRTDRKELAALQEYLDGFWGHQLKKLKSRAERTGKKPRGRR